MDGIFGIGPLELFFIAIIALIVLGPERLPSALREAASFIRRMRELASEFTSQFGDELKALDDINPRKIISDMVDPSRPLPGDKAPLASKTTAASTSKVTTASANAAAASKAATEAANANARAKAANSIRPPVQKSSASQPEADAASSAVEASGANGAPLANSILPPENQLQPQATVSAAAHVAANANNGTSHGSTDVHDTAPANRHDSDTGSDA